MDFLHNRNQRNNIILFYQMNYPFVYGNNFFILNVNSFGNNYINFIPNRYI